MNRRARMMALELRINDQIEKIAELLCEGASVVHETKLLNILTRRLIAEELVRCDTSL